jgi:asparagine synthase (glutamine-hydrolysing)
MPGIAGIVSTKLPEERGRIVSCMVDSMKHEPFYVSAFHSEPEMAVYAGSVALDGSLASGQAYFNEERNIVLLFSGECFLDATIEAQLKQKGHRVERSRVEWLIHLYEEEGDRLFERLNGFFSGVLIDGRTRRVVLFNDRYGLDRLYVHENEEGIYFASEAKALLRVLPELREFDPAGVVQFLTYGCTLEGRTLFRGIHLLPGGSLWSFESEKCHKRKYFFPETWEAQPILSVEDFESKFQETFKAVLPRYVESQERMGISLTGGLDTRMIMACLPRSSGKTICYTFSGETGCTLDDKLAARVASVCGLEHQLLRISADFFSDFSAHVDRTVYITDGYLGATGAHEIDLNKQARQLALVRLTGNYGSEVLRGVSTFKPLGISPSLMNPQFSGAHNFTAESVAHGSTHPVTFAAFREIPWNLYGRLAASRSQVSFRTPYLDNEIVALSYQAPQNLRTSSLPAWGLIKANNTLLNEIPTDRGRSPNSAALVARLRRFYCEATFKLDYLNNDGWPHWLSPFDPVFRRVTASLKILGLHKYLHYRSWFRREFAEYVKSVVTDARTRRSPLWNSAFLECMAQEHIGGRRNYVSEINAVLTLEAVDRLLFRELPSHLEAINLETNSPTMASAAS